MNPAAAAVVLAAVSAACLGPVSVALERARWTPRAPRAAVALWQCLGVGGALGAAGAGLAVAVIRFHAGFFGGTTDLLHGLANGRPLAGLGLTEALGLTLAVDICIVAVAVLAVTMGRTVRARARHRRLLDLVGRASDRAPGAALLDHPRATAYCVPGVRPRIAVSSGTLRLLDRHELAAVLDHERGHAQERHGLVLLPLVSFGELFRWLPYAARAPKAVAGLLEMAADDYAARHHDPRHLATALLQMTAGGAPPACALGLSSSALEVRVRRLLHGRRRSRPVAAAAGVAAAAAVLAPLALLLSARG
jgi:Zn-dependent protease with chaperone function